MKSPSLPGILSHAPTILAALLLGGQPAVAALVINDDFDDGTVTGWVSQGNTRTFSAHNITESGSVLSSEVVASQTNTHRGIVSTTSFDPVGGFSMTFVVDSVGITPGANGHFLGGVTDNSVFLRDASASNFGLNFFGTVDSRTGSGGGFGIIYGDNNGGNPSDFILGNSDAQGDVQLTSYQDGFTATVIADLTSWSYNITGLNTAAGTPTTFGDTGTWADAGTSFAALFGADDSWFATAGIQHTPATAHTASYDLISVNTIPEPSSALLLCAGVFVAFARRRR